MSWTLAAAAAGGAVSAAVYLGLARLLWGRPGAADARTATRAFAVYWGMTGTYQALTAAEHALAAAGFVSFDLVLAVRYVGLALATAGVASLLYYFLFLLTGHRAWLPRIAVIYAFVLVLACYQIWSSEPIGVAQTAWSVDLAYARDLNTRLFLPSVAMLLLAPIIGAGWYLTLMRKATSRRQRYRIGAVGAGVGLQLLSFLVARLSSDEVWQLVSRVILGFVVAFLVFTAYAPFDRRALAPDA